MRGREIQPGNARRHDDVGERHAVQEVVGRPGGRARAHAETARGIGLRVEIDHEHRRAGLRKARRDVDGGGRLADTALLVRDCIDARHRPDPTVAIGRTRGAQRALGGHSRAPRKALRRRRERLAITSTPGHSGATQLAPQRRGREARARRSRARATTARRARPAGRAAGTARRPPAAARAPARRRRRRHRAARRGRGPRSARRARATRRPISAATSAMNAALRAVASIRWIARSGRTTAEHEARQAAAAADIRQRPGGRGIDGRQARERLHHMARRGLGGIADRGDADRASSTRARRAGRAGRDRPPRARARAAAITRRATCAGRFT